MSSNKTFARFPFSDMMSWSKDSSSKRYIPAEFCQESSLHGLKYIGQPKRHIVERVFWVVSFLTAVSVATVFIVQIWEKYRETPVITVFQPTETPIDRIPFPAVTICNTNNAMKSKAKEYIGKFDQSPDDMEAFSDLYLLDHICQTSTTFSEAFNFSLDNKGIKGEVRERLYDMRDAQARQRDYEKSIAEVLQDVAQKCTDMIPLCMWQNEVRNCSELFDEVETDFGYCCVFNMIPQSLLLSLRNDSRDNEDRVKQWAALDLQTDNLILPDDDVQYSIYDTDSLFDRIKPTPKYPFRQNGPARSTGLSVLLNPDLEDYFCTNTDSTGFMALAHLPIDFPNVGDEGVAIKPNSETYLKIRPEVTLADKNIRGFSLEKRNCYFGKEFSLKYYSTYTSSNCEKECIANITFQDCNCVRYFMPRDEEQEICGARKWNCSEKVRQLLLKEGLKKWCRNCLPTCTEIEYQVSSSYMPLRQDIPMWKFPNGSQPKWANENVTVLHVHFAIDSTYPKLRKELYGFVDLLSNTGGLLGLCLGFSALSLLEVLYFLTLRCYCKTQRGRVVGEKINVATQKLWDKAYQHVLKSKEKSILRSSIMESEFKGPSYPNYEEGVLKGFVSRQMATRTKDSAPAFTTINLLPSQVPPEPQVLQHKNNQIRW